MRSADIWVPSCQLICWHPEDTIYWRPVSILFFDLLTFGRHLRMLYTVMTGFHLFKRSAQYLADILARDLKLPVSILPRDRLTSVLPSCSWSVHIRTSPKRVICLNLASISVHDLLTPGRHHCTWPSASGFRLVTWSTDIWLPFLYVICLHPAAILPRDLLTSGRHLATWSAYIRPPSCHVIGLHPAAILPRDRLTSGRHLAMWSAYIRPQSCHVICLHPVAILPRDLFTSGRHLATRSAYISHKTRQVIHALDKLPYYSVICKQFINMWIESNQVERDFFCKFLHLTNSFCLNIWMPGRGGPIKS